MVTNADAGPMAWRGGVVLHYTALAMRLNSRTIGQDGRNRKHTTSTHTATMPRELRQSPALPAAFGKKRRGSRGRSNLSRPRTRDLGTQCMIRRAPVPHL